MHVAGLLRLDVMEAPSESIYVTVWASALLSCHMGKTEKAEELFEKHLGDRLAVLVFLLLGHMKYLDYFCFLLVTTCTFSLIPRTIFLVIMILVEHCVSIGCSYSQF